MVALSCLTTIRVEASASIPYLANPYFASPNLANLYVVSPYLESQGHSNQNSDVQDLQQSGSEAEPNAESTDKDLAEKKCSGKGQAGLLMTTGNSRAEVVNIGLDINRKKLRWNHFAKLAVSAASYNGQRSTESYLLEGLMKYDLEERQYLFSNIRYFNDKFDAFGRILSGAAGAGFRPVDKEKLSWDVFAGLGYIDQALEQNNNLFDEDISGITFLGLSTYRHQLTQTAKLGFDTRVEYTPDNTLTQNEANFSVAINATLDLKLAYELRYNSAPGIVEKNLDTKTTVNVVYSF